jgi:MFS superfamily sulfate permease-like transporter
MDEKATIPAPENKPLDTTEDVSRSIFSIAVEMAIDYILAEVPALAIPVIKSIFVFIVHKLTDILYEQLRTLVAFSIISVQVEKERKKYEAAVTELKQAQASGDPLTHEQAKQKFKDSLRDLVRFGKP